jgi:CBS domain-containing protein
MNAAPELHPVTGAGDARRISVAQVLVYELRVRDAMSRPPITATPRDSLRTIQQLMKHHKISGVPICDAGTVAGIVSIEDIINALDCGHINDLAGQWMTRDVFSIRDHFSLIRAVAEFDRRGFGRFPVVNGTGQLVGVLTRGDVTSCLMHQLEKRVDEVIPVTASTEAIILRAVVRSGDFDSAGKISQRLRQVLRDRGINPDARRRAAIVGYEAETNIIIHSLGGEIVVSIDPGKVTIDATDTGPGIEDINQAMQEGWSTAGRLARELGFGAGMGLPNMKKCSDFFEIKSGPGRTTHVHAEVFLR